MKAAFKSFVTLLGASSRTQECDLKAQQEVRTPIYCLTALHFVWKMGLNHYLIFHLTFSQRNRGKCESLLSTVLNMSFGFATSLITSSIDKRY